MSMTNLNKYLTFTVLCIIMFIDSVYDLMTVLFKKHLNVISMFAHLHTIQHHVKT